MTFIAWARFCVAWTIGAAPLPLLHSLSSDTSYFTTPQTPTQVARSYLQKWTEEGRPVVMEGDFITEGTIATFDTRVGVQTALIVRRQEGQTFAFISTRQLRSSLSATVSHSFPSTEGTLWFEQEENGAKTVAVGTVEKTRETLMRRYAEDRFVLIVGPETLVSKAWAFLQFKNGQKEVEVTLSQLDAGLVMVTQRRVDARIPR